MPNCKRSKCVLISCTRDTDISGSEFQSEYECTVLVKLPTKWAHTRINVHVCECVYWCVWMCVRMHVSPFIRIFASYHNLRSHDVSLSCTHFHALPASLASSSPSHARIQPQERITGRGKGSSSPPNMQIKNRRTTWMRFLAGKWSISRWKRWCQNSRSRARGRDGGGDLLFPPLRRRPRV